MTIGFRGNFFNYLYNNILRRQINSVTSCGTNALWSMHPYSTQYASKVLFNKFFLSWNLCSKLCIFICQIQSVKALTSPKKQIPKKGLTQFNFEGQTFIEDTENSHLCFARKEGSICILFSAPTPPPSSPFSPHIAIIMTQEDISQPLVFGSVKEPESYGEAPSRWAAGMFLGRK